MGSLFSYLPSLGTIVGFTLLLFLLRHLFERRLEAAPGHRFRNQIVMLAVTAVGLFVLIIVLPIGETTRGQLLTLIGILLSAAIALSSTTFLGNALAGLMLRAVRSFRSGDFIRTGEHFGRVSERGLFHTEIQTESRELTTLPNLYLVTHPVTTIRSSGTIISATVSLGYDVPRSKIEEHLLAAAGEAELAEPFVQILELGDFAVTYRVAGLLTDVRQTLSAQSGLKAQVLDHLHAGGVEIVSPSFMNTRAVPPEKQFIPEPPDRAAAATPTPLPEELVFDKADEAESLEALESAHAELLEKIEAAKAAVDESAEGPARAAAEEELSRLQSRREQLEATLTEREAKAAESD